MISIRRQNSMFRRLLRASSAFALWCLVVLPALATTSLSGNLTDPAGDVVRGATIRLVRLGDSLPNETLTDSEGQFSFGDLDPGEYRLTAEYPGFAPVTRSVALEDGPRQTERMQFVALSSQSESVTVTADVNEMNIVVPDPAERVFVRQDLIDANPGRPGTPVSIPGYPIETASSGIKAPQYFAPGVAGDHGEPVAQFIAVGGYLVPNNLSANAHGNGYADPNILIAQVLERVHIDGGAFNVREGNHSVNLAATYDLRDQLEPFLTVTSDRRDIDVVAGFSLTPESWIALEAALGDGLLDRR